MKRVLMCCLVLVMGLASIDSATAARRVVRRGPRGRTVVVVRRGWPLRRPLRRVVVHAARVAIRVQPGVFLAPVVFAGVVIVAAPPRDVMVWEDGETLSKDDDWSEFTLDCNSRGTKLWLEIASGRAQFDWAEVVFENGDTQVVDFAENTHEPGLYSLLDFRDGRRVDHVRMVARARTGEARIVLRMEK